MHQSPITDKTLGIPSAEKYREVKQRAQDEERDLKYRKARRDKTEKAPKFKIGDKIVITTGGFGSGSGSKNRHYNLVEILDIEDSKFGDDFSYYGIVLKTTLSTNKRIGRLIKFNENQHWFEWQPANVEDISIKWAFTLTEPSHGECMHENTAQLIVCLDCDEELSTST